MDGIYGLTINNAAYTFKAQQEPFFDGLNALFEAKKVHFVVGKNGVGKSTLFRLLRGFYPDGDRASGFVTVNDMVVDLQDQCKALKRLSSVRLVDQRYDQMLADQFSFSDNLRFACIGHRPQAAGLPHHQPLPDFLQRFAIPVDTPVRLLSGGQRQILTLLMALQKQTEVLLLDEPTASLDTKNADLVMEFIYDLVSCSNLTVLVICHDQTLVERYVRGSFYELVVDDATNRRQLMRCIG